MFGNDIKGNIKKNGKARTMKKFLSYLLIVTLIMGLTACSKSSDDEGQTRKSTEVVTDTSSDNVTPTEEVKPTEEAVVTEAPVSDPTATTEPAPTEEAAPTDEPAPTDDPDVQIAQGPEVSELPDMDQVFETYFEYVRSCMDDEYELFETMRFGLAFIDNDELPELLIADASYHASGVKIVFYNNGNPVNVGEVGEYGCFSYVKNENHIISSFMNMGIIQVSRLHVDPEYKLMSDLDLYYDENDEENYVYKVNEEEVDADVYEEKYDEVFEVKKDNPILYVNYYDLLPYYPYACDPSLIDAFDKMYEELKASDYISFSGYSNENLDKLFGGWALVKGEVYIIGDEPMYYEYGDENSTEGFMIASEATVDKYNGMGIWISTYYKDEEFEPLTFVSYVMPLTYFSSGIGEGLDYGWSVKAENGTLDWEIYACVDDEGNMILALTRYHYGDFDEYGNLLSDWAVLTYEPYDIIEYTEESDLIYANIERKADADTDGKYAFTAKEYIWVTPDDTELIEEFNLPEDLDGYDYEIIPLDKDEFIFYIDDDTYIEVLNFDDLVNNKIVDADDFAEREYFGDFELYFYPDGTGEYAGKTAVSLIQDYTG